MQFPPQRGIYPRATPPHLQAFPPRPSPQDEMMDVQGVPIVQLKADGNGNGKVTLATAYTRANTNTRPRNINDGGSSVKEN